MDPNTTVYFTLGIGYHGANHRDEFTLEQLGEGIVLGIEIYGVGAKETNIPPCGKFTEKSRQDDNLSKEYVMIEELGELAYCIDTSIFRNNECPVVSWIQLMKRLERESLTIFISTSILDYMKY
ncbi:SMI1/KNR4 family protein [Bacillus cereus group sp. BfR-BA-01380]|uniref:SMI1/KNR4 family protein n=1 Tax=Bacillus cereus group sp. BfR-BA-01380 TaxID=2920324 RepID=UPI001F5A55B1|nr:SMI1/KNR4 family protein [Bacillus cereus group sp. BfR-BA-01380]